MSSKLHRGGLDAEPIDWNRAPATRSLVSGGGPSPASANASQQAPFRQGFEEGQSAARREIGAQFDAAYERLARTIEELSGLRARFRHEAEEEVVALALAVARRILHRELTVAPDALLGLVKAELETIQAREVHRVRVHPADVPLVQQPWEKRGLPRRVEVSSDPSLARGSAIFDSTRGALDSSVDTQLEEIERGFADLMRRT